MSEDLDYYEDEDEDERTSEHYIEKRKGRLGKAPKRESCKVCHKPVDSTYEDRIITKVKGKSYVYNYMTYAHYSHDRHGELKITKHRVSQN